MEMDFKNKITSFKQLGMFDPIIPDIKGAIDYVNMYSFQKPVYPEAVIGELVQATVEKRNIKPPKCIFVPEKSMVRRMVQAVAKNGAKENYEAFFLKFGLLDDPNWYLD